ncbi:hypothetical protein HYH03_002388 [Edaphochlamys debaryana]|uniref:tRNA-intron lyase n=1 Tax=Edaphochlamys debaryana TaxID=47281 RepID=A0A835YB85_9CHLO|nr:hypothetical protein HYH03_002388 [Edaphochlamys debaryana]|eukprot:KAG2499441.1 hypothetical protein HYH03_002388 [Edaphochlamys debaryana]
MRLRKRHRIMGCLVGSVAQYKSQNEVNALPLELSADEVTLASRRGWVQLLPETAAPVRAAAEAASAAAAAARAAAAAAAGASGRGGEGGGRPWADESWHGAYAEYYSQWDPRRGFTGRRLPLLGPKRRRLAQQAEGAGAEAGAVKAEAGRGGAAGELGGSGGGEGKGGAAAPGPAVDASEPGWRVAVTEGGAYKLPLTAQAAAAARAGAGGAAAAAGGGADAAPPSVRWSHPASPAAALRYAVFEDLHDKGFTLTGGLKFGADMLAYPGDPSLYHAQFTVRAIPSTATAACTSPHPSTAPSATGSASAASPAAPPSGPQPWLNPMGLKAAARGSHGARKHMLLAYLKDAGPGRPPAVCYFTFAPEAGFGGSKG